MNSRRVSKTRTGCVRPCAGRLRDDSIYGAEFVKRVDGLGLEQVETAPRSPWQNCYAERWILSLRRDCLDHIIALDERQVLRVVRSYVDDYHRDRTHLGREKDTPEHRPVEGPELGDVVALPRVGGFVAARRSPSTTAPTGSRTGETLVAFVAQ